jgi:hypothetical protein
MRMSTLLVLLVVAQTLSDCDDRGPLPVPLAPSTVLQPTPSPPPQPPPTPALPPGPIQLAIFTDPATRFSTSDVHDVHEEVICVNTANELIWVADGTRFQGFIPEGNFIAYHHVTEHFFQIRFGTNDGQRRAYVTWPDDRLRGAPATILDLWVDGHGDLKVAETNVTVPY